MLDWLTRLLDTQGFPPRWVCGEGWTPFLGWLHILSDTAIGAAYIGIPLAMWYFARKRTDIRLPRVFWLYVLFILSCGVGHLIEAGIFYWPVYRLAGLSKLMTAAVSVATLIAIIRVLPTALNLPGMAKMNAALKNEIAQRQQVEDELEAANLALVSSNDELKRFLYSASHDLKAPVVTTQGFAGFIRADLNQGRTDRLDGWFRRIEESSSQMATALDDLLVLGRLGYIEKKKERVALDEVVKEVVSLAAPRIEASNASVTVDRDLPEVMSSDEQIRRLVQNLLDNALIHGVVDGRRLEIQIGAERVGDRVHLRVSDNGPGIDPAHHGRVFHAFERLQNKTKGTGLGLSIVARIAENTGGKAWIESPPTTGASGTVFWVELPAWTRSAE